MKNWSSYQNNEFSSDASEDILWLIFDKALNKNLSDFTKLMNQVSKGCGYSPFEYLGYSLLNDYDENEVTKHFIVIESGSECFKMEVNYYGEYGRWELRFSLQQIDMYLIRWAKSKYKRLRGRQLKAAKAIRRISQKESLLFAHWKAGFARSG